ncbi:MAG: histidinol dehydrogenase [Crocinitomicaceae bacterium]|nr:histidinol dehydrogenase [Crocinitomicaceae bacterium]
MKKYIQPDKNTWSTLMERPQLEKNQLDNVIQNVFQEVKINGDQALMELTQKFDGADLNDLEVSMDEIERASEKISEELKAAIQLAKSNIEAFHKSQLIEEPKVETTKGVQCWRKSIPIEKVGLYIPGGSAPLFSTILMLGIPSKLAGCKEIILCTPPNNNGEINPAILYTAKEVGCTKIYKVGGAQAIAGMTLGTEIIPKVSKIFGPGNQYVTKAKEMAQQMGTAIDMPAGPSEVLVIADATCNPAFVAADLLSQAEHGADSQVILLSDKESILDQCMQQVEEQLKSLPRKEIAQKALENSRAIQLDTIANCIEFSNAYAPEHLILAMEEADAILDSIQNAGSVFIGNYSCESAGDYASGTNHTLPTNGFAKNYSGVSIDSFVKKVTFQKLSAEGIQNIGPAIEIMAEAEELFAHKNAVTLRLKNLENV